ncbi:hypothetical protein HPB48_001707 [Haemaphysalis longicornis]|uniref:ABC transporter domain-containing protein n=1 Tax=Haemaphysalis longicornis TaxID=44386 RepID=A0A9J6FX93_HAELO|nr:hypothetical protein HPB48_001707 [Haemaphysalis longicornis]
MMLLGAFHSDKGYEGEVQVNGYVRDSKLFNMQSCYVMQDDCLLQYLTVREALIMSAELRLPTLEQQELIKLVADTISGWGLGDCADTLTHRLSGGEKRRLAISQELISRAPVNVSGRADKTASLLRIAVSLFFAVLLTTMYYGSGNHAAQARDIVSMYLLAIIMIVFQSVGPNVSHMAVFVSLPAVAPWFILSGYFVQQRYVSAAIKWFTYTSHVYYGHRALMFVVFGGGRPQLECDERDISVACHPIDGEEVLDMLEARDINLSEYLSILLALDVSFKLFAFCLLKWRLWRKC